MRSIFLAAMLAVLMVLNGCTSTGQVAGGATDDFPNSRAALAKVISASVKSSDSWTRISALPDTLPDTLMLLASKADSLLISPIYSTPSATQQPPSLSKALADFDSLRWDLRDSTKGFVVRYHYKEDMYSWMGDTAVVFYNAQVLDSISYNETMLSINGRVNYKPSNYSTYHFIDTDTNTFLDSSAFAYATEYPGYTSIFVTTGTSGNDNSFTDLTKLKVASIGFFDVAGYDTLQLYMLSDADHDGNAYASTAAVNDANFRMVLRNRVPGEVLNDQRMVAWIKSSDSGRVELLRYWSSSAFVDGRTVFFWVNGPRPDSIYLGGDTATVTMITANGSEFDTVKSTFKVATVADMYDWEGHRMPSYTTELIAPRDSIRRFTFKCELAPALSIHDSLESVNGSFNALVDWCDGSRASISGTIVRGNVEGTYVGNDGKARKFSWSDRLGLTLE
jgi:hypothetical protein